MKSCTDLERQFVIALLMQPSADYAEAARAAGYSDSSKNMLNVAGHTVFHRPRVQEAIREEADRRIRGGAILGASVLIEIARNSLHKDQYKAAVELLNRAGMLVATEHKVTVSRPEDEKQMVERIMHLALQLGLDGRKLLGSAAPGLAPPIDVEYTVIEPSKEGLEDLL